MINENGFISGEELDALKDADIDFWVSNLIEKDSLTLISAPKGLGKSWFLLSLGTAVSSGDNFLDYFKTNKTNVLYIDQENGYKRLRKRQQELDTTTPESKKNMFYSYLYREDGTVERLGIKIYETSINPDRKISASNINRITSFIVDQIKGKDVHLVLIDNYLRTLLGKENEGDDASDYKSTLEFIRSKTFQDLSFVIAHNFGKNKSKGSRGAQALEDCSDNVYYLRGTTIFKSHTRRITLTRAFNREIGYPEGEETYNIKFRKYISNNENKQNIKVVIQSVKKEKLIVEHIAHMASSINEITNNDLITRLDKETEVGVNNRDAGIKKAIKEGIIIDDGGWGNKKTFSFSKETAEKYLNTAKSDNSNNEVDENNDDNEDEED